MEKRGGARMRIQELSELITAKQEEFNQYKNLVVSHSEVYYESAELMQRWLDADPDREASIKISQNFTGININFRLAEKDNIEKNVLLFVDECEDFFAKFDIYLVRSSEHVSGRWVQYHLRDNDWKINVHLFFNYELAEACKVVGSGEFEEKLIRVCK